jgi:hypothetical protein
MPHILTWDSAAIDLMSVHLIAGSSTCMVEAYTRQVDNKQYQTRLISKQATTAKLYGKAGKKQAEVKEKQ